MATISAAWSGNDLPTERAARPNSARREAALFAVPLVALFTLVATSAVSLYLSGVAYDGGNDLNQGLLLFAAIVVATMAARMIRGTTIAFSAVEGFALVVLLSIGGQIASAAVAVGSAPLIDPWLAAADRVIAPGWDWPAMIAALGRHPWLHVALTYAYASLSWQPVLFFAAGLWLGTVRKNVEFAGAYAIALLLCVLPFHWLPALGPYPYYGISAQDVPGALIHLAWEAPEKLTLLRSGAVDAIGTTLLSGLICIPSFHAAGAVLMATAFWDMAWLRWPMLALNLVMFAAAGPIGGHYYVDLLAGGLAAVLAVVVARRCVRSKPA